MAIARPIRLLGAVGILGVLLVLYRLSQTSQLPSITGTTGTVDTDKITDGMKRDPLLDREFFSIKINRRSEVRY